MAIGGAAVGAHPVGSPARRGLLVLVKALMGVETARRADVGNGLPADSLKGTDVSLLAAIDLLTASSRSGALVAEALLGVAATRGLPVEAGMAHLAQLTVLPIEGLKGSDALADLSLEVTHPVGAVFSDLAIEALSGTVLTSSFPSEWEGAVLIELAAAFALEALTGSTAPTTGLHVDTVRDAWQSALFGAEGQSGVLRDFSMSTEGLRGTYGNSDLPIEHGLIARLRAAFPAEWRGTVALILDGMFAIDTQRAVGTGVDLHIEVLAGLARDERFHVDALMSLESLLTMPTEALREVAAVHGTSPVEFLAGFSDGAGVSIPAEALASVSHYALLPVEYGGVPAFLAVPHIFTGDESTWTFTA